MTYAHITVDAGAAQKFYHVVWNSPEEFKNVVIHLGDFHGIMEFFGTIGKFVLGSGFEDVVYQAGLCTSGGIKGILTGKHYNRSWMVHECFAEATDRLFCESFVNDVPSVLEDQVKGEVPKINVDAIVNDVPFNDYVEHYNAQKQRCLRGDFGKTPQFWMFYQKFVERQHQFQLAINTNDFDLRLKCWKESLPLCFSTNKQNYARYGTYYCRQLQSLEIKYPGAKDELLEKGLSVCRNTMNVGQSIDGAGEQTFMRSSKTTGKLHGSASLFK